jgi:DNA-binding CsgD family transcriptional regulator
MAELGLDADLRLGLRRAIDAAARNPRLTLCAGCGKRGVGSCGCLANLERAKPTLRNEDPSPFQNDIIMAISAKGRRRWHEAFCDRAQAVPAPEPPKVPDRPAPTPPPRVRRKYQARPKPGPRIIQHGGQEIVLPRRYADALVSPSTPAETLEAIQASIERVASLPPAVRGRLSFREADVLALLVLEGLTNQQIAARLSIRHEGVRSLFRKIYRKLGERASLELANVAERFANVPEQFSWKV